MDDILKPTKQGELIEPAHNIEAEQPSPEAEAPPLVLDEALALEFLAGDTELLREIQQRFLSIAPGETEQLKAAIEAGDLQAARNVAHSVKSAAASIGAVLLSSTAKQLELAAKHGELSQVRALLSSFETDLTAVMRALGDALA